jgi:2-polyprenyl-6-methoxyphenol hydroxylase-like FAD-dependent oxidoreductase
MGLDAAVRAACTDTAGAHRVDADGNVLQTYRADDNDDDGYISQIEVLRGDFSQLLYDDTRDGVDYVFGDRIAELTQDADGVEVTFASGERRRFELVIGADGLHSALREMVFGPREQFVRHLGLVLAFYSVPNEFGLDRWLIDYQDAGRSAGLRPIHDASRAIAMLSFPAPDFDIDHRDVEAQKRLLREQMAGLGWMTPRILAHLDDTRTSTSTRSPRWCWTAGPADGWGFSETRRSARRRCPAPAPDWPWSAPTCWPESSPPPTGTLRPDSLATRSGCAPTSRPTRRSAGCTCRCSPPPTQTPSRARSPT